MASSTNTATAIRSSGISSAFRHVPKASDARLLTDGIRLSPTFVSNHNNDNHHHPLAHENDTTSIAEMMANRNSEDDCIMPWVGFGTYKLGQSKAQDAVLQALGAGYRHIDTAFIYSRQRTEAAVGKALQQVLVNEDDDDESKNTLSLQRNEIFVTSKHWRTYHGYEPSLECLKLSLERLQLDYLDLWLMHWPGPAWKRKTPHQTKKGKQQPQTDTSKDTTIDTPHGDHVENNIHDPWQDADCEARNSQEMQQLRAETWRAMEDAYGQGKVRAIGVCNFSVAQLQHLEHNSRIRPMVCQVEYHPLCADAQQPLLEYCHKHGIIVQAYASLGGQDTSDEQWQALLGERAGRNDMDGGEQQKATTTTKVPTTLLTAPPVMNLAQTVQRTPAQVLLRWAMEQNCVVLPKTSHCERLQENAQVLDFSLTDEQVHQLSKELQDQVVSRIASSITQDPNSTTNVNQVAKPTDTMALGEENNDNEAKLGGEENNDNEAEVNDNLNNEKLKDMTRLCWRGDRFRLLDF